MSSRILLIHEELQEFMNIPMRHITLFILFSVILLISQIISKNLLS